MIQPHPPQPYVLQPPTTHTQLGGDMAMSFELKPLNVRGRIIRLGPVLDDILQRHSYPPVVSALLGEALSLTAMLGTALKFQGKFILQTKTDGPVDMIVTDFRSPDGVRGYARFHADKLAALGDNPTQQQLLGNGYLAMTVDQGQEMERYQGIVPLEGHSLTDAADLYFHQSEQIPTRIHLAAGPILTRDQAGDAVEHWRAGAIMVQHLPSMGGKASDTDPASLDVSAALEAPDAAPALDDGWERARILLDTVEDHELLDPQLSAETVLYRLYHEDGVTVYPALHLARYCTCSSPSIHSLISGFPTDDRAAMVKDGAITVTCEFCSTAYRFEPHDFTQPPDFTQPLGAGDFEDAGTSVP